MVCQLIFQELMKLSIDLAAIGGSLMYASPLAKENIYVNGELWQANVVSGVDICDIVAGKLGACKYVMYDEEARSHHVRVNTYGVRDWVYVDGLLWKDDVEPGTNICGIVRSEFGSCSYQAFTTGSDDESVMFQPKHFVSVK
jgi:hypothetical protein